MGGTLDTSEVEKLLNGIAIPPRPQLLLEIDAALKADDPDLGKIAQLVTRDVGISAAILKTLNSPIFGLGRKIGSVAQAIALLGTRNTRSIVTGLVLRNAMGKLPALERFWDSAEKVAGINAFISSQLPRMPREDAYTFGLFRDCGIPLMLHRFPGYRDTLKTAPADDAGFTVAEDRVHGTNHATIGYLFARTWGLSEVVCEAIRHHHDPAALDDSLPMPGYSRSLIAVNLLGEHLHNSTLRMRDDRLWELHGPAVLDYLGLNDGEFEELSEEVLSLY